MNSTTPCAGTTVPAEGVSHWLGGVLRTATLEDGLVRLLSYFEGDASTRTAIWVWPGPQLAATGIIGSSRFYDVRQQEFVGSLPAPGDLAHWSFPEIDPALVEIRPCRTDPPVRSNAQELPAMRTDVGVRSTSLGALCWVRSERPAVTAAELAWLSTLIEHLAARELQLRDAKLKSLAEFAGGAGHEINNPLGTILGRSQLLLRQEADPERRRWLTAIGGQALRIRDMISDTMVYARPPIAKPRPVDIEPLIHSVTDRFDKELAQVGIQLHIRIASPISGSASTLNPQLSTFPLDPEQFQVVCIELLRNAIRAVGSIPLPNEAGQNRRIGLRARQRSWQGHEWLELDLCNNGPELTPAERTHAFDPFYSGRDAGRGLGFGLTKCWRIVTGHGGRIGVHSTAERTVFRTLWPACRNAAGE